MKFSERLKTLMSVYRINNVTLAAGIGADPSIVSRWRNGDRAPGSASSAPADIAAYLSGLGMLQHDRETLEKIFNAPCDTKQNTAYAIEDWLKGREPSARINLSPESPELAGEMFRSIGAMFDPDTEFPPRPVSLFSLTKRGNGGQHEVFEGSEGMRSAVVNVLYETLSRRQPGELMIMPPQNDRWLDEDPEFKRLYSDALRAIVRAGHTITMAHPKTQGEELPNLITNYMPLYSTGRFFSYGCSRNDLSPAVFVLRGSGGTLSQNRRTILFRSPEGAEVCEEIVQNRLLHSRPLAMACSRSKPEQLLHRLCKLVDRPGELYETRNTFPALFTPEPIILRELTAQTGDGAERRMEAFRKLRDAALYQANTQKWTILCPANVRDAAEMNGSARLNGAEFCAERDVTLEEDDLRAYIESLISHLERYPKIKLFFTDECPPMNISVKEGAGSFFIAADADHDPLAVNVGDISLSSALRRWFAARVRGLDPESAVDELDAILLS